MLDKSWMLKGELKQQYANASYQRLRDDLFLVDKEVQKIGAGMSGFVQGTAVQLYKYSDAADYLRKRVMSHPDFIGDTRANIDKIMDLSKYGDNLKYIHNAVRTRPWALSKESMLLPLKKVPNYVFCYGHSEDKMLNTKEYKEQNLNKFLNNVLAPPPLQIPAPKPRYIVDKIGTVYEVDNNHLKPIGHVKPDLSKDEAIVHGAPRII